LRFPGVLIGLTLLLGLDVNARSSECHIHPPQSSPSEVGEIIGPFATRDACEQERERRFGSGGRCHCRADFTPRWLPLEPLNNDPLRPPGLP